MTKRLSTFLCLMWVFYPKGSAENHEQQFFNKHFSNLSTATRPSVGGTSPVNVTLDLAFAKLGPLDLKAGTIKFIIWFRVYWEDKRLTWDPLKNNNRSSIVVPYSSIWHPDIIIYNSAEKARAIGITPEGSLEINVKVNSDGTVFLGSLAPVTTFCQGNIEFFPYDDQECHMTMATWSRDRREIDLFLKPRTNSDGVDIGNYDKSTEWELLEVTANKRLTSYGSIEHVDVQYTARVRRMPLYYIVNYTLPTMIVAVVAMLVFLIPPEVGKRMEAGINLLLCLSVYLLLVNNKVPNISTSFPMLTKFYGCTIIILVVSMCCSCWVYSLYFMNSNGCEIYQMNSSFRIFLFDWLGPLLKFPRLGDHSNDIPVVTGENKLEAGGKPKKCNHAQRQRNSETNKINGKTDDVTESQTLLNTETFYENDKLDKGKVNERRTVSKYLRSLGDQTSRDKAPVEQDKQHNSLDNKEESNKLFRNCPHVLPRDRTKTTMDTKGIPRDEPRDSPNSSGRSTQSHLDFEQTRESNKTSRGNQNNEKEDSNEKTGVLLPNDGGKTKEKVGKTEERTEEGYRGGKREKKEGQEVDKEKKRSNKVKPEEKPESNENERKKSRRNKVSNPSETVCSPQDSRSRCRKTVSSSEVDKSNQASGETPKRRTGKTGLIITPELTIDINTQRQKDFETFKDETDKKISSSSSELEKNYQVNKAKPKRRSKNTSSTITPGLAAEANADRKIELRKSWDETGAIAAGKNKSQRNPANKTCSEEQLAIDEQEKSVAPALVVVSGSKTYITKNSNDDARYNEHRPTRPSSVNGINAPSLQEEIDYQRELVQCLSRASEDERMKAKNVQEWKRAANILNRFFLLLMITSIVISFLASFLASPRVREKFKL